MSHVATRLIVLAVLTVVAATGIAVAQSPRAWYEGFETAQTSWRLAGGDVRCRSEEHRRVEGQAHTGSGCEYLRVSGAGGSEILYGHSVGQPRIIDELMPTVWIKSDRPGLQFLAQVVMPRTTDPRTNRPATVLIRGSSYTTPGRWQQLRIDDFPRQLSRQTWVLRTQIGPGVDPREAYIGEILLNVYGGPGVTNVWIDDLDIGGYVGPPTGTPQTPEASLSHVEVASPSPPFARPALDPADSASQRRIEVAGSVLLVDKRPIFPRAVQYQGEPLKRLRELGFNVVWLPQLPTVEMVEECRRVGLWLVCPPPRPAAAVPGSLPAPFPRIGPLYDCVLAWDMGRGVSADQLEATQSWAQQVRAADGEGSRPLVCQPMSGLRAYSGAVDFLLIGRSPLGSSLELGDYGTWIRQRPRLARPGTAIWTTVQTQPSVALRRQWSLLGCEEPLPATFANEQIRLLTYTSMTAGSRGFLFESESSLAASDADTRLRAATLELLNLELELVEPFVAGGSFLSTIAGSEPGVVGAVLQTDRARILVPIWTAPGAQFVSGQSAGNGVSFVVPGVPESNKAFQVLPGGLRPLWPKRVTGGTRITLDEFALTSLVLFTQDPLVINSLAQRSATIGRRAAELQRELAAAKLAEVERIDGRLAGVGGTAMPSQQWLTMARQSLQSCDGALAAKDDRGAYLHAERAMRPLRLLERERWQAAVAGLDRPVASPAAACFATLPSHWTLLNRVRGSQIGENRLVGGSFEDLPSMLQTGWRHFQHRPEGIYPEADLSPAAAHSGRYGLRMAAMPAEPNQAAVLAESPPVWITSPGVSVHEGELICIQGWVQIPAPITGSVDGLLIVDSFTGEALAERIGETSGWQQFTLYRVAPETGYLTVTFALSGLGEVWLDDVRIQPVAMTLAARSQ